MVDGVTEMSNACSVRAFVAPLNGMSATGATCCAGAGVAVAKVNVTFLVKGEGERATYRAVTGVRLNQSQHGETEKQKRREQNELNQQHFMLLPFRVSYHETIVPRVDIHDVVFRQRRQHGTNDIR